MKTVFITITRGFIVRNILRSGVLSLLKERGYRIVILFPKRRGSEVPQYLRDEFEDEQVVIEGVLEPRGKRGYHFFSHVVKYLVYSKSTWTYEAIGSSKMRKNSGWVRYVRYALYFPVRHIPGIKNLVRAIEYRYFVNRELGQLFEKYKPALIFSTSILASFDVSFMKEGRRRGIKSVGMPKGWDNISKVLYRFIPDHIVVQNELMKRDLVKWQGISPDCITVVGFPQFDWHRSSKALVSRKQFMESLGFSETDRLIFFGSEGAWTPNDHTVAEFVAERITQGSIPNAKVLARPHFSDVYSNRFDYLKDKPNIRIDEHFHRSEFFVDNWDPDMDETIYFTNLAYHADILITTASTLTLDCAASDTPLINIAYGGLYVNGKDVTAQAYDTQWSQWVIESGAVTFVRTPEELLEAINRYLEHPDLKREERKRLIESVCYKVDGNSSRRVVDVLDRVMHNSSRSI